MTPVRYLASIIDVLSRPFRRAASHRAPVHGLHHQKKIVERELEMVFRAIDSVTILVDGSNAILWLSPRAISLFGIGEPSPAGQPMSDLFVNYHEILEYLDQTQFDEPILVRSRGKSEPVLELRVFPYGVDRKIMIAHEDPIIRQLQTIRQDFIVNVSHELRTPLTVLFGYLEAMNNSAEWNSSKWKPIIDTMYAQTYRMQHIVNKLMQLAMLENNISENGDERETVDIKRILAPILIEARHLSGISAHVIDVEYSGDARFFCFAADLSTIMSNLVFNAVKYTPPGGRISVKWSLNQQEATFVVSDTGIGISEQHIPRLTERFYRVDTGRSRDIGGTGLGLAIVKHAVLRMGGRLEIESQLTKGSLFRCHIPVQTSLIQP